MNKLFYLLCILLVVGCNANKEYDEYQTLKDGVWNLERPVVFKVPVTDTLTPQNVFLNVRSDSRYSYRNLYVMSKMTFPNGIVLQDTLEYEMADAFGNWLGKGITDVKENKLYYLENFKFPVSGNYQIEFFQMMRSRGQIKGVLHLKGITDVGLSIKKTQP